MSEHKCHEYSSTHLRRGRCSAGFQIGKSYDVVRSAGLETRDWLARLCSDQAIPFAASQADQISRPGSPRYVHAAARLSRIQARNILYAFCALRLKNSGQLARIMGMGWGFAGGEFPVLFCPRAPAMALEMETAERLCAPVSAWGGFSATVPSN